MAQTLVRFNNISKRFYDCIALENVSFSINRGESIALFGENGSGKTILCKLISGALMPDNGTMEYNNTPVSFSSIEDAKKLGIRMIYQNPQTVDNLTVAENIFLVDLNTPSISALKRKELNAKAAELLKKIGCDIAPDRIVGELSTPEKKLIEIAKSFANPVELLIIDETTELFSSVEIIRLLELIKGISESGTSVIFVSHHIDEIKYLGWRTLILQNGSVVDDVINISDWDRSAILASLSCNRLLNRYPKTSHAYKVPIFQTSHISNASGTANDASIEISKGEIVGIYGLSGSGKSSFARLLCGIDESIEGDIYLYQKKIALKRQESLFNYGIGYLSDDISQNVFPDFDGKTNMLLGKQIKMSNSFYISPQKISDICFFYSKNMNIPLSAFSRKVRNLSRGTQQKIAIARLLNSGSSILIMDEPSMHLDISSKVELYNIMNTLAKDGKSIIIASSNVEEILGMCDRVYVVSKGEIVAEVNSSSKNAEEILKYVC